MTGCASDAVTVTAANLGLPSKKTIRPDEALRNVLRQLDSQMETGTK